MRCVMAEVVLWCCFAQIGLCCAGKHAARTHPKHQRDGSPGTVAAEVTRRTQMKLQAPRSKIQRISKIQIPSSSYFGVWLFDLLWILDLVFWIFARVRLVTSVATSEAT